MPIPQNYTVTIERDNSLLIVDAALTHRNSDDETIEVFKCWLQVGGKMREVTKRIWKMEIKRTPLFNDIYEKICEAVHGQAAEYC
jgi:hypothetical protein